MKGKTAVISGSSTGIGAAIAEELSTRGANIVLNYPFPHLQAECERTGAKFQTPWIAVCADLSTASGPADLVSAAVARFKQIDILVSNAGVVPLGPLAEADAATWDQTLNLNCRGAFLLVKAALPHLTPFKPHAEPKSSTMANTSPTGGGSRIIVVGSVASRMPEVHQTIYAASKGTLDAMIRVWARELPPLYGCTVNGVAPGPIATDTFLQNISSQYEIVHNDLEQRTPVEGAFGDAKDVAWAVAFLAEERSRWINGEYLLLTGGCYIH